MTILSKRLTSMIAAAQSAGDRLKLDFAEFATLNVEFKNGPGDPFSAADLRAEETIRSRLRHAEPDYGFLGEEGGMVVGADPAHTWIVDPLDGTMNFLVGLPIFAVNIALAQEGRVVAGVTYAPMLGEMFWAESGGGAFLNGTRIRVSERPNLENALLSVGAPFLGKPRHDQFHAEMRRLTPRIAGLRRLGAGAIDMAYVACGRFDAYWEQSVSPWDMAAGAVLVTEAGGIVSDTLGAPLDLTGGTVLACAPQLRSELLHELRPVESS